MINELFSINFMDAARSFQMDTGSLKIKAAMKISCLPKGQKEEGILLAKDGTSLEDFPSLPLATSRLLGVLAWCNT